MDTNSLAAGADNLQKNLFAYNEFNMLKTKQLRRLGGFMALREEFFHKKVVYGGSAVSWHFA